VRKYPARVLFIGGEVMAWEAPDFIEVRMDAEINSYQDDFDREQDDRF
jgi:coenzyme PQQ precursor peptide PqqA